MSFITEEDIKILKNKNPELIFIIGPRGVGKTSQVEKISKEFRYTKLDINNLIDQEIIAGSELGQKLQENSNDINYLIPIFIKGIINSNSNSILIDSFPETLEQFLYFEKNAIQISLIINLKVNEEVGYKRILEQQKNLPIKMTPEEYKNIFDEDNNKINDIVNFYEPYGIVREVDGNKPIGEVNALIKQNLYPVIYSIIGKRYSGKTELGKILSCKTGIFHFDFNDFLKEKNIKKRKNENEFVISQFILKLRKMRNLRVLIEDFPQNEEQFNYFVNNCKNFEKIYYLNADNSSCLERLNKIPLNDPNYIPCHKLGDLLCEFERKLPFIETLKKKTNVFEIDVNNHKILTVERMLKQIQPYLAFISNECDENVKTDLFNKLISNYKFYELNLPKVIENAIKRNIIPESSNMTMTNEEKLKLIQPLIFREGCNKIILNTYPITMEELNFFEKNLCSISKFILLTNDKILTKINNQNSMPVYFYNLNKFSVLNPEKLTDYNIEESLDMRRDINIVYGMPLTGKSTIAKHLELKYNFKMLNFIELTEQVKKTKVDPENPEAEVEINFQDLINGLKDYLNNEKLSTKIIIDNLFIPGGEGFLIDTYEKALEVIHTIGSFRNLYEIKCSKKTILNKYKNKEGINEDLNDDQKTQFNEFLDKPKKLLEEIKKVSANVIKVNCDKNESISKLKFDFTYGRNCIAIKHDYDINIEKTLQLFCTRERMLYINVPKIIYNHFYENDLYAKRLEGAYGKRVLKKGIKNPNNCDELIYYKYNPINFEQNLVNEIIINYINENNKLIEKTDNFIILTGYLNSDLLLNENQPYDLPLLEIKKLMEIGDLTSLIEITKEEIEKEEKEEAVELIIEKKKKVVERDPLDVDPPEGEANEENKEEENKEEEADPEHPKFKPEGLKWTDYDGHPRNYVQVLKRLKRYPIKEVDSKDCRKDLINYLGEHIDQFFKEKTENKGYSGVIDIIKLNDNVTEENVDLVNSVIMGNGKKRNYDLRNVEKEEEEEVEEEEEEKKEEEKKEGEEEEKKEEEEN